MSSESRPNASLYGTFNQVQKDSRTQQTANKLFNCLAIIKDFGYLGKSTKACGYFALNTRIIYTNPVF
jgi:hypothetical protein